MGIADRDWRLTGRHKRSSIRKPQFAIRNSQFRQAARVAVLCSATVLLTITETGCILGPQHPAATQPVTAGDAKSAQPAYWLDQPAVTHVDYPDFDALWNACRLSAEADGFAIDRRDYREGRLTTRPLISKQFYEFWHGDVRTAHDLAQSSLGMMRRTVRFTIERLPGGGFRASPKVLVERDSLIERRITSVDQYQNAFAVQTMDVAREAERSGTEVPAEYWYAVGRDPAVERQLADAIRDRLPRGR